MKVYKGNEKVLEEKRIIDEVIDSCISTDDSEYMKEVWELFRSFSKERLNGTTIWKPIYCRY